MILFLAGLGYMIWFIMVSALNRLDETLAMMKGDITKMPNLPDIVGSKILFAGLYQDVVFYVLICLWIFAVIDAYRIGRQRELQDKEIPKV